MLRERARGGGGGGGGAREGGREREQERERDKKKENWAQWENILYTTEFFLFFLSCCTHTREIFLFFDTLENGILLRFCVYTPENGRAGHRDAIADGFENVLDNGGYKCAQPL